MTALNSLEVKAKIEQCIKDQLNFAVVAGAGSGKTTSLIETLNYINNNYGANLRANSQKVACITFTNNAVEIIKRKTNSEEVFEISTIHAFLWKLVKNVQSDIRETLKKDLLPKRIEHKRAQDDGGSSQRSIEARKKVIELTSELECIDSIKEFKYDLHGSRNYSKGHLDHDDIVELVPMMLKRYENFRNIIGYKFPYILLDEAQDTFLDVMEMLNVVASKQGLPIIGYFGDPMQQIYENRAGNFHGPNNYIEIKKCENFRCSHEVIKLLNTIRQDLQQIPGENNQQGSVELRLVQSQEPEGPRNTYSLDQLAFASKQFDDALDYFEWKNDNKIKQLFLTRQMISQRTGFANLNKLFTGPYSSMSSQDAFKDGEHYLLKPFIDTLIPIYSAYVEGDESKIINILRQKSVLLDPNGQNAARTVGEVLNYVKKAIESLIQKFLTSTTKDLLCLAQDLGLIITSDRMSEDLTREPRSEIYDDKIHSIDKSNWLADDFFKMNIDEILVYRNFILNNTPYNTQHGVKGDEFDKVLVVFDDIEASWNLFSFSRLFFPKTTGSEPTEGQKKRSLNLAYVCFSRAIVDLRIVMFSKNPEKSKQELIDNKFLHHSQISIQN